MTILLTGATGYLGGRIGRELLMRGHRLVAVHLNRNERFECPEAQESSVLRVYLSESGIEEAFAKEKIDGVIHTSTVYGRNREDFTTIIKANVEFPVGVLMKAIAGGVKFFINTDSILRRNVSPYALSKGQFVDWMEMAAGDILTVSMKLDHFFGPGEKTVKFVARILNDLKANAPRLSLTAGTQTRDFIYVDDVVSAYMCVIDRLAGLQKGALHKFEVGTGVRTSIRSLVTMAKELTGSSSELGFGDVPFRENEMLDYEVNSAPLRALGWEPKVSVREGLERCVAEGC